MTGRFYRLPTEAGSLNSANLFGLLDMHGNVWEWTADYWHSDYDGAPTDGSAWDEPELILSDDEDEEGAQDISRAVRGGGWDSMGNRLRSASRFRAFPSSRFATIGFRVVVQ